VMGHLDGETFWVGCGWFFLTGRGGGRENTRSHSAGSFFGRHVFSNRSIFYVIYYIENSGGFATSFFRLL
jgi:hypothetical protein